MIAGGAESCIHPLAIGGFARSRSLATKFNEEPQVSSRPFDRDRDGFVISEGAACVVLEVLPPSLVFRHPLHSPLFSTRIQHTLSLSPYIYMYMSIY